MIPTNNQPQWACPEWGNEHDWLNCPACLAAQEEMIEQAQEAAESEAVES
jgi:hypothetical protein